MSAEIVNSKKSELKFHKKNIKVCFQFMLLFGEDGRIAMMIKRKRKIIRKSVG